MSAKTLNLTPALHNYLLKNSLREAPILQALRAETAQLTTANMQISPEQGQLLAFLVELIGAKKTLEMGTYTGYSALVVALALPEEGKVIACDINAEWAAIAKRYWQKANVAHKIELRLAPALETLDQLLQHESERFDFAFIDADKANYTNYYEKCLRLVRSGGLIVVDNVLWGGDVADPKMQHASTNAIRALNIKLLNDERVSISMIPIGDGVTLVRKR